MRRRMTPDAPRSAIPMTTLMIIFLPHSGLPVAIIIPQMRIRTKETIRIAVTNILVMLHIRTGNAVSQVTLVSPAPLFVFSDSMHLPIKGTEVLSCIQQQTHFAEQDLHSLPISLYPSLHVHHKALALIIALDLLKRLEVVIVQGVPAAFGQQYVQSLHDFCSVDQLHPAAISVGVTNFLQLLQSFVAIEGSVIHFPLKQINQPLQSKVFVQEPPALTVHGE